MGIGERIKMARAMAGLSVRSLAAQAGVSATAISKYERGLDAPGSRVLIALAQSLNVKVEYFLRPVSVSVSTPAYRRRASLPCKQEAVILGQVQEWLERYLELESLFGEPAQFVVPPALGRQITTVEDAERVALELRGSWHLGLGPIESLTDALEQRGIKVGVVDSDDAFDALMLWANGGLPVIVIRRSTPGDRQRFNLAHELGHLVVQPANGVDAEAAAYRFAGAFLVPRPSAFAELGEKRQTLGMYEMHLLKHKYGLSMQAWVHRAQDLGILSGAAARQMFKDFRSHGWHKVEPGDSIPPEEPARLKRLVLRALAEDAIMQGRAAELLGMPFDVFCQQEAAQHGLAAAAVCGWRKGSD